MLKAYSSRFMCISVYVCVYEYVCNSDFSKVTKKPSTGECIIGIIKLIGMKLLIGKISCGAVAQLYNYNLF